MATSATSSVFLNIRCFCNDKFRLTTPNVPRSLGSSTLCFQGVWGGGVNFLNLRYLCFFYSLWEIYFMLFPNHTGFLSIFLQDVWHIHLHDLKKNWLNYLYAYRTCCSHGILRYFLGDLKGGIQWKPTPEKAATTWYIKRSTHFFQTETNHKFLLHAF